MQFVVGCERNEFRDYYARNGYDESKHTLTDTLADILTIDTDLVATPGD
jgi:hypothetical protein